jgi:hypothetical protein
MKTIKNTKTYVNIRTGSTGTYDEWDYTDENGKTVNAVDLGEVEETTVTKFTLVGQNADSFFGKEPQIFTDTEQELRDIFADAVISWGKDLYSTDYDSYDSVEDAIASIQAEFDEMITQIEI